MAAIVHAKQSPAGAATVLTIASATAGNELVAFFSQASSVTAPLVRDPISGPGVWTVHATHAVWAGSASSLWMARKTAVGGETEVIVTAEGGGSIHGIGCFEVSGGPFEVESIVHTDNIASGKAATSPALTTTNAGDVILGAVGCAANTGTISAWSGTGPMTNVETTTTQLIGGSYIPGTTLSGATFTGNWETAKTAGILVVAFKPVEAAAARSVMVI